MKNLSTYHTNGKNYYIIGIGNIAEQSILKFSMLNLKKIKLSVITQAFQNPFDSFNKDSVNLYSKSLLKPSANNKKIVIKPENISQIINPKLRKILKNNLKGINKVFIITKISSDFEALLIPAITEFIKEERIYLKCIILNPFKWEGTYINQIAQNECRKLNSLLNKLIILKPNDYNFDTLTLFSINSFIRELSDKLTKTLIDELIHEVPELKAELRKTNFFKSINYNTGNQIKMESFNNINIKNFQFNIDTNKWILY